MLLKNTNWKKDFSALRIFAVAPIDYGFINAEIQNERSKSIDWVKSLENC